MTTYLKIRQPELNCTYKLITPGYDSSSSIITNQFLTTLLLSTIAVMILIIYRVYKVAGAKEKTLTLMLSMVSLSCLGQAVLLLINNSYNEGFLCINQAYYCKLAFFITSPTQFLCTAILLNLNKLTNFEIYLRQARHVRMNGSLRAETSQFKRC